MFYMKGSVVDVSEAQAAMLIRGRYAELVETGEAKATAETAVEVETVETADVAPEETAKKATKKKTTKKKA